MKKTENATTTYYLRSTVLGGQVISEMNGSGTWTRGYVYQGGQLLAVQQSGSVTWVHTDPITKGQRMTDVSGNIVSTVELDPWGRDTSRSSNGMLQPHHYTTYERDGNSSDEAMFRRYNRYHSRFDQPDPYEGSYDSSNPQSFNRYAYTHNDPVNFTDPTGLYEPCVHKAMTKFLANLAGGYSDKQVDDLGKFTGDEPGGADSSEYAATSFKNAIKGFFGKGPSAQIHFASEATLAREIGNFGGYLAQNTDKGNQRAAFVLHSIQDVHGAHMGYHLPFGHFFAGHTPDRVIGDDKFLTAANESFQLLSGDRHVSLTAQQVKDLINAVVAGCGKIKLQDKSRASTGGGGGGGGVGYNGFGGYPGWWYSMWSFVGWVNSISVGYNPESYATPNTEMPKLKYRT